MTSVNPILPSFSVVRTPDQISGVLDEQAVLLSIENGAYYQMNRMATKIWAVIERPCLVSDLIQLLQDDFDVDHALCEREVITFLSQLQKDNLLQVQTAPA